MMGLVIFLVIISFLILYFVFLGKSILSKNKVMLKRTVVIGSLVLFVSLAFIFILSGDVFAEEQVQSSSQNQDPIALGLKYVGAALAVGLAAIGAGIAVGPIGVSAISVIAEKPEMFGTSLIFIGLAEGIAIYGIAIAILIMFVL
ncbi:MAG: ATP synthase subunit C [Brevinematales bacterium]|nr:ATP synthase subunit C [Brevinematales bacterium]